jgi:hypothetical protein
LLTTSPVAVPSGSGFVTVLNTFDLCDPPGSSVIFDPAGNIYGTTSNSACAFHDGTVFEMQRQSDGSWSYSQLYFFNDGSDGLWPQGRLLFLNGVLYGSAEGGNPGDGVIFSIQP